MSFSETTAKRTTREKNTVCTYFSLQWVASWRVPENTKANHQQTKETLPFLNLIHHSRVSRSTFATKQGLTSPFISNRLHKLHCEKSKSENRRNLSKVEHYCTCLLTGFGTPNWQNLQLFSKALGLMECTTAPWKAVTQREIMRLKKSSQHETLALNTMLFLNSKDPLWGGTQKAHNSWPIWFLEVRETQILKCFRSENHRSENAAARSLNGVRTHVTAWLYSLWLSVAARPGAQAAQRWLNTFLHHTPLQEK